MQKGTTFVAHVYVCCSKSDISNNIDNVIFITVTMPRYACTEAYGVYLCVYLYVCNLNFSKVTKNQALVNAAQVQHNNISDLDI